VILSLKPRHHRNAKPAAAAQDYTKSMTGVSALVLYGPASSRRRVGVFTITISRLERPSPSISNEMIRLSPTAHVQFIPFVMEANDRLGKEAQKLLIALSGAIVRMENKYHEGTDAFRFARAARSNSE
jgi:hypothetical protein